jgi:hypothetical protein
MLGNGLTGDSAMFRQTCSQLATPLLAGFVTDDSSNTQYLDFNLAASDVNTAAFAPAARNPVSELLKQIVIDKLKFSKSMLSEQIFAKHSHYQGSTLSNLADSQYQYKSACTELYNTEGRQNMRQECGKARGKVSSANDEMLQAHAKCDAEENYLAGLMQSQASIERTLNLFTSG